MSVKYTKLFITIFIFILTIVPSAFSKDDCNFKFTVESEGKIVGGMGEIKTTMYHKNCYEWVQEQNINMGGINQKSTIVNKDGYTYINNNGSWTKTKDPSTDNIKKMREEGKTNKDVIISLGGKPLNKESNEYLEPCSFWSFMGGKVCYTKDWIPVYIENQAMEFKAINIKRNESGPESLYEVPANVPESDFMQGGEMPDMKELMKEAM
ncbi:MAG: hypothetical protein ACR2NW_08605 [Thermodesulfobacteriota bacterium]